MSGKKRCFVSVRALKRLNKNLLCEVLEKFPGYLHECRLKLPDPPEREELNYDAIQEACMSANVPPDLDDVLFFVSLLGTKRGQSQIENEARQRGRKLDFRLDGLSCPDFAMKAWLHEWPANRNISGIGARPDTDFRQVRIHAQPDDPRYPVAVPGTHSGAIGRSTSAAHDTLRQPGWDGFRH